MFSHTSWPDCGRVGGDPTKNYILIYVSNIVKSTYSHGSIPVRVSVLDRWESENFSARPFGNITETRFQR